MNSNLVLALGFLGLVSAQTACPLTTGGFNVITVATGSASNTFNIFNQVNPPITLKATCQYEFAVGSEFHLKSAPGTTTMNDLATGVTNNGASGGTITYTPGAAGTFYYMSGGDAAVYGVITVVNTSPATCATYCSDLQLECGFPDSFVSQAECESTCAYYPSVAGYSYDSGATRVDSFQCRAYMANQAVSNASPPLVGGLSWCNHANVAGGTDSTSPALGFCSMNFYDSYCDLALSVCTGSSGHPGPLYSSLGACVNASNAFFHDGFISSYGSGYDDFECRLFWAVKAASSTTYNNCNAASLTGGGLCGGPVCDAFCNMKGVVCSDFVSSMACQNVRGSGEWYSGCRGKRGD